MQYMGGKARIARRIVDTILADTPRRALWVEPFVGGGNVLEHAAAHFDWSIATDGHADLMLMWQAAVNGWRPGELTRERYVELRTQGPSAERGFAGFGGSFGGKWFGGYGVSPRDGELWRASLRALDRQAAVFASRRVAFARADFGDYTPPPGAVVYCDPPYAGTTGYRQGLDYELFYTTLGRWARSGCAVYVSEYAVLGTVAATVVWQRERRNILERGDNISKVSEKLFRIEGREGRP
jgi:DNA adenine methylase